MSDLSSSDILVTGATGFIGSHLCRELINQGYHVFGLSHSGNTRNIKPLLTRENLHLLQGDVRDIEGISRMVKDNHINAVLHLAARLPAADDFINPLASFDINARGTLNLLHAARVNKVDKFIYSSSIDVYSEPPEYLPVDEKHPTQPRTNYGIAKLAGELYANLYAKELKVTILRYSIGYGQGGKATGAVNRFISQALRNEPLTVHGGGRQSNDFVCVGDEVQANLLALKQDRPGTYNIGSGEETSVKELAQAAVQLTGSTSTTCFVDEASNRPFRFALDISRARQVLGYQPRSLRQGLAEYIGTLQEGE